MNPCNLNFAEFAAGCVYCGDRWGYIEHWMRAFMADGCHLHQAYRLARQLWGKPLSATVAVYAFKYHAKAMQS